MLMNGIDLGCSRCHVGTLILVGRAGRVAHVGGAAVAVPVDFMVPTCNECGDERWTPERIEALTRTLADARTLALRFAPTEEMDALDGDEEDT